MDTASKCPRRDKPRFSQTDVKQVRPGRAKPEMFLGHQKSETEIRRLSADMHRGQRASLGNQANHAIKAGYKDAADFFAK